MRKWTGWLNFRSDTGGKEKIAMATQKLDSRGKLEETGIGGEGVDRREERIIDFVLGAPC